MNKQSNSAGLKYGGDNPYLVLFVFAVVFQCCESQVCTGDDLGFDSSQSGSAGTLTMPTVRFPRQRAACKGVIHEWRFQVATCTDAWLDVWRDDHVLLGRNYISSVDCIDLGSGEVVWKIPVTERIPVDLDYYIGFFQVSTTDTLIQYKDVAYNEGEECAATPLGSSAADCTPMVNREYFIKAEVIAAPMPVLDNLDATVFVYENELLSPMYTVSASHISDISSNIMTDAVSFVYDYPTGVPFSFVDNSVGDLEISTAPFLNYEDAQEYLLLIRVFTLGQNATATLTVIVQDRNDPHTWDNLPTIVILVDINDNCSVPVLDIENDCPVVDEDDAHTYTTKQYYMHGAVPSPSSPPDKSPPFILDPNTGVLTCTPELATWSAGYDPVSYVITLSASDVMHQVFGDIIIEITGAHEAPVIDNLDTTIEIPEDTLVGTPVHTVTTTPGIGTGPIVYSILEVLPLVHASHFSIDNTTGVFTLEKPLDVLVVEEYTVLIGVNDDIQAGESKTLTVDVKWVNHAPVFSPNIYHISIPEECSGFCNSSDPWLIPGASLHIVDREVGANYSMDYLSCSIFRHTGGIGITFITDCSNVYIKYGLDIDDLPKNRQIIEVEIKVLDSQNVGGTAILNITVYDINDNAPEFVNENQFEAYIDENTPGMTSLFKAMAKDKDSGLFGEVRYYLYNSHRNTKATRYLEIDEITGEVYAKQAIDFEYNRNIEFIIQACDRGFTPQPLCNPQDPLNASQILYGDHNAVLHVVNVNDYHPHWRACRGRSTSYEPYIPGAYCFFNLEARDDVEEGHHVQTVKATDYDSGQFGFLTYHLLLPEEKFEIGDAIAGDITVLGELESYTKYVLYVWSQDNYSPSLRSQLPDLRMRVDTYDPERQLIFIILNRNHSDFDVTAQEAFLQELYTLLNPWFPKIENTDIYESTQTKVMIYALEDTSTYDEKNLHEPKFFVDRDDLHDILRKNFRGHPSDDLLTPPFQPFDPIQVGPRYPIWIIETIPGIITLCFVILAVLALIIGLIVGLCHRYKKCCFKPKPGPNETPQSPIKKKEKQPETDKKDEMESESDDEEDPKSRKRRSDSRGRRGSTDTVHSLLYDPWHGLEV